MRQVVVRRVLHRGWGERVDGARARKTLDPASAQRSCGGDGVVRRRALSPRQGPPGPHAPADFVPRRGRDAGVDCSARSSPGKNFRRKFSHGEWPGPRASAPEGSELTGIFFHENRCFALTIRTHFLLAGSVLGRSAELDGSCPKHAERGDHYEETADPAGSARGGGRWRSALAFRDDDQRS